MIALREWLRKRTKRAEERALVRQHALEAKKLNIETLTKERAKNVRELGFKTFGDFTTSLDLESGSFYFMDDKQNIFTCTVYHKGAYKIAKV